MGAFFCFRRCAAMRLSNSEGSDAANTAMALIRTAPIILRAFVFAVAMGVGPEAGGRCLVIGMARGVHCCALKRGGARSAPLFPEAWWGDWAMRAACGMHR